jgi:hypothetical protein
MEVPDRLTIPTCIGCGAMAIFGTCETGCTEQKLELVRAAADDALLAHASVARLHIAEFGAVAERLADPRPSADEVKDAYWALQEHARAALRRHPDGEDPGADPSKPAEPAITWWCPDCGKLEAPQPCLGICVWRRVEWVNQEVYEQHRQNTLAELEQEDRLRRLLRRLTLVTPRPGQWHRSWNALRAEAQRALEDPDGTLGPKG